MESKCLIKQITAIVAKYVPDMEIAKDIPLTLPPYNIDSRSLAAIFIDIANEYEVDLNNVIGHEMDYTISSIAEFTMHSI